MLSLTHISTKILECFTNLKKKKDFYFSTQMIWSSGILIVVNSLGGISTGWHGDMHNTSHGGSRVVKKGRIQLFRAFSLQFLPFSPTCTTRCASWCEEVLSATLLNQTRLCPECDRDREWMTKVKGRMSPHLPWSRQWCRPPSSRPCGGQKPGSGRWRLEGAGPPARAPFAQSRSGHCPGGTQPLE